SEALSGVRDDRARAAAVVAAQAGGAAQPLAARTQADAEAGDVAHLAHRLAFGVGEQGADDSAPIDRHSSSYEVSTVSDQTLYQKARRIDGRGETIVTSTCGHNCGGRCVVNAHVVDDRIVRIS